MSPPPNFIKERLTWDPPAPVVAEALQAFDVVPVDSWPTLDPGRRRWARNWSRN